MFSQLFGTARKDTKQKLLDRYNQAARELAELRATCPTPLKSAYENTTIRLMDHFVNSLLFSHNECNKKNVGDDQLNEWNQKSQSDFRSFQASLSFMRRRMLIIEHGIKAGDLIHKAQGLLSQRLDHDEKEFHLIPQVPTLIQEEFRKLLQKYEELQDYNTFDGASDFFIPLMIDIDKDVQENIRKLEAFCHEHEMIINKQNEALTHMVKISKIKAQEEKVRWLETNFFAANTAVLTCMIQMLDKPGKFDLLPLDSFIEDLKKEYEKVTTQEEKLSPRIMRH